MPDVADPRGPTALPGRVQSQGCDTPNTQMCQNAFRVFKLGPPPCWSCLPSAGSPRASCRPSSRRPGCP
eukprot:12715040-Alexandrium_andersonii.AAC.1